MWEENHITMIRAVQDTDTEAVLDIWLRASIEAHDFVDPSFWEAQVENIRSVYLPASESYVSVHEGKVVGFYSLHEDTLAAIFVSPEHQGQGFGNELLSHAKQQRDSLSLAVYKANEPSVQFYLSRGFSIVTERTDVHTGHAEYLMSTAT